MVYLVDTNILVRFAQRTHSLHLIARAAVRNLRRGGHQLHVTSQNCIEFWHVATRPIDRNGLGLAPKDADRLLRFIERLFHRWPDTPALYPEWRRLVVTFGVSGVQVHDARLVAAATSTHSLSRRIPRVRLHGYSLQVGISQSLTQKRQI